MKEGIIFILLIGFSFSAFCQTYDVNGDYKISGNVGIGTLNPTYKLYVQGNTDALFRAINYTTGQDGDRLNILIKDNLVTFQSDGSTTPPNFLFKAYNKEVLYVSSAGIGIGINAPSAKLDLWSHESHLGRFCYEGDISRPRVDIWGYPNKINIRTSYNTGSADLSFGTHNVNDALIIKQNGNVGIGTTDPQSKLAVNGTITTTEVVVTTKGWSDFVFNKDYELKDIEEIENFIEENNHLPDIPSEKEVKENGIQVGEMNAKLLQKIEELTLYMIEQNKMMKAQNEEIKKLKEEINTLKTQ